MSLSWLSGAVMLCYAAVYKTKVVDELPQEWIRQHGEEFTSWMERRVGLFDVFGSPNTCLFAFCCSPVVAAKNYQVGRVLGFWPSCIALYCFMYSPFYLIGALIRTILSMQLNRNLGYHPNFFRDCFFSVFCFWCEVGRESLEVDEAIGVKIRCAFDVELSTMAKIELAEEHLFGHGNGESRSCRSCSLW